MQLPRPRALTLAALCGLLAAVGACRQVTGPPGTAAGCGDPDCASGAECADHAKVCRNPTVHALAHDLDHAERHIDWFGSVSAKVPDVWGQARLTEYREQFEGEMAKDLNQFESVLNGSVSRSDQAFFSFAAAIGAAASPGDAPAPIQFIATSGIGQQSAADAAPAGPAVAPADAAATGAGSVVVNQPAAGTRSVGFAGTGGQIKLEPTLHLAQKARYLDFLNQLRRTNEGSDTADGPGYALNLFRVPVSVFPGKKTDVGYGAEITMTIDPVLGDDLLPTTFRSLLVNDLVHSLGFPLTKFLDEDAVRGERGRVLTDAIREKVRQYELGLQGDAVRAGPAVVRAGAQESAPSGFPAAQQAPRRPNPLDTPRLGKRTAPQTGRSAGGGLAGQSPTANVAPAVPFAPPAVTYSPPPAVTVDDIKAKAAERLTVPALSFANGTQSRTAFPTSQIIDVYGIAFAFEIGDGAQSALAQDIERNDYVHLPDVQAYLRDEIRAAYLFLTEPANQCLWAEFCTPELVAQIRSQRWDDLRQTRRAYRDRVQGLTGSKSLGLVPVIDPLTKSQSIDSNGQPVTQTNPAAETRQLSVTSALAWAVLVDAALLTDRLGREMKETATAKGAALVGCDKWLPYFLPDPPPEARSAFNDYVKLRWPVYVFALDPVSQEQNLADTLVTQRETQLALAVAFTQGAIGANTLTRYARRLEAQYETVALNRTQVGFAHGENTFGWRFYPRFQTPDTSSNLTTLVRDQLIGGPNRDQLLRQRRLEPGTRDCVALVIAPAFVPYVTVDAVSNWFALANPKHKAFDHTQAARMSKTIKTLERCGAGVTDADCYRDGELRRMQKRVAQLGERLPAQTLTAPVPVVNTLGGFELFSNGTTDFAPELYGWYGAPGVSPAGPTTLFLVGDHFSPLRSRVVAGNREVKSQRLLSRQVIQVTLEHPPLPVTADGRKYAQVHLATPYGVSRELLIPIVDGAAPAPATAAYTLPDNAKLSLAVGLKPVPGRPDVFEPVLQGVEPVTLTFDWDDPSGVTATEADVAFEFPFGQVVLAVPAKAAVFGTADSRRKLVIGEKEVAAAAADLVRQLAALPPLPLAPNPLAAPLASAKVTVTPRGLPKGLVAAPVAATGKLVVEFRPEVFDKAKVPK